MRHLRAFHVFHIAATSASFTDAAAKLCITHGAVSKQIKQLEQYLNKCLFIRQGRRTYLSPDGEALYTYTQRAFDALDEGIQRMISPYQQSLEVSCEPTLTMRWLMPRLAEFYRIHPGVDVRLSTAGGPVILGASGVSLAIRRDDFELVYDYQKTALVEEWVGPVFAPAYWQSVSTGLSKVKRLHSKTRQQAWQLWSNAAGQKIYQNAPNQTFEHFYFCLQAVVDGLGTAIGPYPLVMDELKRGNLVAPFGFIPSGYAYVLLSQHAAEQTELTASFIDWLQKELVHAIPTADLQG